MGTPKKHTLVKVKDCKKMKSSPRPNCFSVSMTRMDSAFMLMPAMKCEIDTQPLLTAPTEVKDIVVHMQSGTSPEGGAQQFVDFTFNFDIDAAFAKKLFTTKIGADV